MTPPLFFFRLRNKRKRTKSTSVFFFGGFFCFFRSRLKKNTMFFSPTPSSSHLLPPSSCRPRLLALSNLLFLVPKRGKESQGVKKARGPGKEKGESAERERGSGVGEKKPVTPFKKQKKCSDRRAHAAGKGFSSFSSSFYSSEREGGREGEAFPLRKKTNKQNKSL